MDTNLMVHVIFESHWKLSLAVKTAHGITTFFFLNTEDLSVTPDFFLPTTVLFNPWLKASSKSPNVLLQLNWANRTLSVPTVSE